MADEKTFINTIAALLILFGIFMIIRFIFGAFDDQLLNPQYLRIFKFFFLAIIYSFFSIFAFINSYGLFKFKKWAIKSVSVLSILFFVFLFFFTNLDTFHVIFGIFFLIVILYINLNEEVKKLFNKKSKK